MDKKEELKIIQDLQKVVEQMKLDDIEDNPETLNEIFQCNACGEEKCYAGSVVYGDSVLCNDCVLYAEIGFALGKIKSVNDVISVMEDKRLEDMCEFIKQDRLSQNN